MAYKHSFVSGFGVEAGCGWGHTEEPSSLTGAATGGIHAHDPEFYKNGTFVSVSGPA